MYIPKRSFFRGSFTMFVTHLIYRLKNRKKVEPEYYEFMTVFSANEIRLRLRKMIERVLVIKIRST